MRERVREVKRTWGIDPFHDDELHGLLGKYYMNDLSLILQSYLRIEWVLSRLLDSPFHIDESNAVLNSRSIFWSIIH